jgi:hypothetical protein
MSRSYSAHAIHGCKTTRSVSVGIAAALLLFVGVGAAADPSLQRFVSSEGRFSVLMPGTPTSQIVPVPSGPGKTTNLFEFSLSLENGDVRYLVTYYDYPPGMNPGTPEATLEAYRDGITIGKTLLSDKATVLNGVTGRAFTAQGPDGHYDVQAYYTGDRLYVLIVFTKADRRASDRNAFMSSFEILTRPSS